MKFMSYCVLSWFDAEQFPMSMMTSPNGNIFRVTGHFCGEFNGPRWIQWRGALMFSLICVWINGWVNNREAGDLRRYRAHYDVIVMLHGYGLLHRRGEMKQRRRIQVKKSHDSVAKNGYGLLQVCSNSIANALELLQSCTEPLIL